MTEEELLSEICSVFYTQMDKDKYFQFAILQPSGGGGVKHYLYPQCQLPLNGVQVALQERILKHQSIL